MSKQVQLTQEQAQRLAPYEKYFGMVHRASYCTYPGEQALQVMRDTWEEVTGQKRQWHGGCPECIMSLVRDLGTLYYAATGRKPEDTAPSKVVKVSESKPAEAAPAPVEKPKAPQATKSPAKPKSPAKSKKTAKK